MIRVFLSLNLVRIAGVGLGYLTIVYLNRSQGPAALGEYMFLLNAVIAVGTLASIGLPTVVQRLGAQLDPARIGPASWMLLRRSGLYAAGIAALGSAAILSLDADQAPNPVAVAQLSFAALGFAVTLVFVETMRIAKGPLPSELQRNVVRPAAALGLIVAGAGLSETILISVLVSLALIVALTPGIRYGWTTMAGTSGAEVNRHVSSRSGDLRKLVLLNAIGLVFGAMDVVLFGLLFDDARTGIYAAASRFAMLINVALVAGNAQMVLAVARVASGDHETAGSLELLRNQVRLVRIYSTGLTFLLFATLPVYAWIVDLPASDLWPYFAIVAASFWLQAIFGPSNMFLMHAHKVNHLIAYSCVGLALFATTTALLHNLGISWAVPMGAAVGANAVKALSWNLIRRDRGLLI